MCQPALGAMEMAAPPSVASTVAFVQQADGSYRCAEAHAHLFSDWHPELAKAPLKVTETFVLDTDRREGVAHITCTPAHGGVVQPNKQRRRRRLNDVKQLNAVGEAALQRQTRPKGLLCKSSVVWRIEQQCAGTEACDASARGLCAALAVWG